MKKKVLVFGATGDVGGRIARCCVNAGHKVFGISRGQNTRPVVDLSGVEMIHGNKEDEAFIRDVVAKLDFDTVVYSVWVMKDVDLCWKYLKAAANVFLCGSTGSFVPLRYLPADEKHPWREDTGVNFWKESEKDAYALDFWEREKFPVTILSPTNIIGPGRTPLELWGGGDIEFYRKLKRNEPVTIPACEHILVQSVYNDDLAGAFVKAMNYPDRVRGEQFITSCKRAIPLGRFLRTAMDFLGSKSAVSVVPPRELLKIYPAVRWKFSLEFLLEHMCFDISKAEKTFGYSPLKSTEEGLIDALEWCEATGLL